MRIARVLLLGFGSYHRCSRCEWSAIVLTRPHGVIPRREVIRARIPLAVGITCPVCAGHTRRAHASPGLRVVRLLLFPFASSRECPHYHWHGLALRLPRSIRSSGKRERGGGRPQLAETPPLAVELPAAWRHREAEPAMLGGAGEAATSHGHTHESSGAQVPLVSVELACPGCGEPLLWQLVAARLVEPSTAPAGPSHIGSASARWLGPSGALRADGRRAAAEAP